MIKNNYVNTIENKINKIITGPIKGFDTNDKYLAELGVSTNQDGTLQLNENTFDAKFDENTSNSISVNESVNNRNLISSGMVKAKSSWLSLSNMNPMELAYLLRC